MTLQTTSLLGLPHFVINEMETLFHLLSCLNDRQCDSKITSFLWTPKAVQKEGTDSVHMSYMRRSCDHHSRQLSRQLRLNLLQREATISSTSV